MEVVLLSAYPQQETSIFRFPLRGLCLDNQTSFSYTPPQSRTSYCIRRFLERCAQDQYGVITIKEESYGENRRLF